MTEVTVQRQATAKNLQVAAWLLAGVVVGFAFLTWSQARLDGRPLGAYDLFPLFGLVAFSLMWTHYVTGVIRRVFDADARALHRYFAITSGVVLVLILLHPGIFLTALWLDGFGLPPLSYLQVYSEIFQRIALLLGTLGLVVFLAFELYRKFRNASWWRYVEYANMAAMFAIFFHALTLGGELGLEWFRALWFLYGATLAAAIIYNALYDKQRRRNG